MRVAVNAPRGIERPPDGEDQQPGDAEPFLLRRMRLDDLEQVWAAQTRQAQDAPRRAVRHDVGDRQLRIVPRRGRVRAALLGFLKVVELPQQRRAQLVVVRAPVERLAGERQSADEHRRVGEVALQRPLHSGILHLDDDVPAVAQPRAVHLAQRGRRERLAIEAREEIVGRASQLRSDHFGDLLERHPLWRLCKEPGDDPARFGRQRVRVHRERLTELERRALELSQRSEDALGRLAQVGIRVASERPARLVRQEVPGRPRSEIREAAQAAEPATLHVVVFCHSTAR